MEYPTITWVKDFVDYRDTAKIIKLIDNANSMIRTIVFYQSELIRKFDIQLTEEK